MVALPVDTWKAVIHACIAGPDVTHALADRWEAEQQSLYREIPAVHAAVAVLQEQGVTLELDESPV